MTLLQTPALRSLIALVAVGWMSQAFGQDHRHGPSLGARGLFLRSAEYRFPPSTEQEIRLVNGTYALSETSTPRDRTTHVVVLANGKTPSPLTAGWRNDDDSSYLKFNTGKPGTHVIGVSMLPTIVEGERQSWHARAILQVGNESTDDFARPLGQPIEILLEKNPAKTPFGQDMSFRVLYQGKPLANQLVHAGYDGYHEHDESGAHLDSLPLITDAQGRASFNLTLNTPWYISLIYMRTVADPDAEYESIGASVTFDTR